MVKIKLYFEIDVEELIQEKQELEQVLSLFKKEIGCLSVNMQKLNAMWEHSNKEGFCKKTERTYTIIQEQTEEMEQLIECMDYAVSQYRFMEERAEKYAKCINW